MSLRRTLSRDRTHSCTPPDHTAVVTTRQGARSMVERNWLPHWRNGMESTVEATVRSLRSKDLAGDPARELAMIAIEYPPGSVDPVHTHHAQALVYVLEGSIVMQVKGGSPVTLGPGQAFYEGPDDV